jgi:hypothetical protein
MDRFNLRKLNDMGVKVQYQVKVSNRYAALDVNINGSWENTGRTRKASATEGKVMSCNGIHHGLRKRAQNY